MKATYDFDETMLANEDKFQNEFFHRFRLRHASQPLQLSDTVTKNYKFPTFYHDVTCAIGIFLCSYDKAYNLVSQAFGPKVKPVKMTLNRSIVAFSCYEYKNVMNVTPYNEIAMTIPIMVNPGVNVPLLPMIADKMFSNFGYYVFSMPVTSRENQIRGNKIWGLPKVTREIDITEKGGLCVITAMEENGEPYFRLRVPVSGKPTDFDVTSRLYSRLGDRFLQSETNFKATFNVTRHVGLLFKKGAPPDRTYLILGDTPSAEALRYLEIEAHPFQFRFARGMNSCFDLPANDFTSSVVLP